MPPLPLKVSSGHLKLIGRGSKGTQGLLATPTLRRFRLSGGGPINHPAGLRSGRLRRLPPLSTMHLRSRCSHNSLRDNRSHLVRGLGTGQELALNAAKMATMPGPVPRTSQLSQLNRPQIPGLLRGPSLRRKCPASLAKCTSQMLCRFCSRSR